MKTKLRKAFEKLKSFRQEMAVTREDIFGSVCLLNVLVFSRPKYLNSSEIRARKIFQVGSES